MALKWYMDDSGDTSMIRIGAMIGVVSGGIAVLAGVVVVVFEAFAKTGTSIGSTLAGVGGGLISLALGCKALQRAAEAKMERSS